MKAKRIIIVLLTTIVIIGAVIGWGSFQEIRLDAFALDNDGVTLNNEQETIQFQNNDLLYRSWNNEQTIETSDKKKTTLAQSSMLFYNDGGILFTEQAANIDTSGISTNTEARTDYNLQGEHQFATESGQTIAENNIVKIENRQYFLPASAAIIVDGETLGQVSNPMLLIDKSGSVTIFSEQKKQRYLGHLILKIDDTHIFDVSNETYTVNDLVIDLTHYGGTDNQKLVVETSENNKKSEENSKSSSEQITAESSVKGANTNGESITIDLPSSGELDAIRKRLEDLNQSLQRRIPTVRIGYINPGVSTATIRVDYVDTDHTLVGPTRIDIIDNATGDIAQTLYESGLSSDVFITGLEAKHEYHAKLTYQFDLGDESGLQSISALSSAFTTQSVRAMYNVNLARSGDMDITVATDVRVEDIKRAEVKVSQNTWFGSSFTVAVDANRLSDIGDRLIVNGLTPNTPYVFQLVIELNSGEIMELNQSVQYYTLPITRMNNLQATLKKDNTIEISYDWQSETYELLQATVILDDSSWGAPEIETAVIKQAESIIAVIPDSEKTEVALKAELVLETRNIEDGSLKTFTYPIEEQIDYKKESYLKIVQSESTENNAAQQTSSNNEIIKNTQLVLDYQTEQVPDNYTVVFECARKEDAQEDRIWQEYSKTELLMGASNQWQATSDVSVISQETFTFRAIIYDGDKKPLVYVYQ